MRTTARRRADPRPAAPHARADAPYALFHPMALH